MIRDAYFDKDSPKDLGSPECDDIHGVELLFHKEDKKHPSWHQCYYQKFRNMLSNLIDLGLYTELVQIPGQQPAQAQANQSNIVTIGRICRNRNIGGITLEVEDTNIPYCGLDKKQDAGGSVVIGKTETTKADDKVINANTRSMNTIITTTKTTILPITGHNFWIKFAGIGRVDMTFELRSPNGFLSYLGAWYNVASAVPFQRYERDETTGRQKLLPYYDTIDAEQLFGDGPYLSILNLNGTINRLLFYSQL